MLPLRSEAVPPDLEPFHSALGRLVPQFGDVADHGEINHLVLAEGVTRLLSLAGRSRGVLLVLEDWVCSPDLAPLRPVVLMPFGPT